ncbi:retention module-containing protein, partial [Cellvibrio sp.]|uniref:retention module-containing protein n=1 Tax=Cellvibrio sp. TaxID=1965322 RepID=UPI003964818B
MANAAATVASLEGQAWAKGPDGKLRPLKVGDTVSADETVITATGARIELDFGDHQPVFIAGGQEIVMNRDVWTDLASDNKESAIDNASVQEALTVLNEGGDLTTTLEETAAGLSGGGSNEGHSFVALTRVVEQTDPNAFSFGVSNPDSGAIPLPQSFASNAAPVIEAQGFTGDEDTPISGRIIATDIENDPLTYALSGQPANGVLVLDPATGNFTYTPNANYNGSDSFIVTVTDDHGNSTTSTVTLTVNAVNDAPVSANQNLSTPEDTPVSGQVVATDVEGDTLTYSLSTAAAHGSVNLNPATGSFVYTPNGNYNGADTFVVTVSDGNGGVVTSTINVGITPVNDAPVSGNQNLTTAEDTPLSGKVVASDVDGDSLSYTVTGSASHGVVTLNSATGAFVYTPSLNYNGSDSFVVSISDGQGGLTTSTINVGVTPVNDAPTTSNQNLTTPESTPLNGQVVAKDVEGDTLSYSVTGAAAHGTVSLNPATGAFIYTPASTYNGPDQFVVSVSDGNGGVVTSTVTINVTNTDNPVVLIDSNAALNTVAEGAATGSVVGVTALGTDGDAGTTVTYSLTDNAGGRFAINATTGVITVANGALLDYESATSHTVTVKAVSSDGSETTGDFTINITNTNDNPVVLSDSNAALNTVAEGAATGSLVGVTALGTDADAGTTVTYSLTDNAGGRFAINATTGVITVANGSLLDYESATSHTVTVKAVSSDGSETTGDFTINITNTNDNPVVLSDSNAALNTVAEGAATGSLVGVTALGTDADAGTTVTYSLTDNAGGRFAINATTGVITVANGSLLDYESATSHTVTVKAVSSDGSETTGDFTINITNTNDNPVVLSDSNAALNTVAEGAANGSLVGVTALGTDADAGTTVTYSLTDNAGGRFAINATTGVITVANGALLDYESATSHTVTVKAVSSDGSETTGDFTIAVTNTNDNPVVLSDSNAALNTVAEGAATGSLVGVTALGTDADAGTTVTYSLTDNAGGRFAINATTGVITVANGALLDYESATSHTVTVKAVSSDGSETTGDFTIAVTNTNDNPVVLSDSNA